MTRWAFVFACLLIGTPANLHAQTSTYVKISFDDRVKLTSHALASVLRSPRVLGKAIQETNGDESAADRPQLVVNGLKLDVHAQLSTQEHTESVLQSPVFAHITLHLLPASEGGERQTEQSLEKYPAVARKLWTALHRNFGQAVSDVVGREVSRTVDARQKDMDRQKELAEQALANLQALRERLRTVSSGVPQRVLEESVANLQRQNQALQLDIVGLKVREDAIQRQIKEAADELKKAMPDDTVLKYLERVLQVRTDQLARFRELHRQGSVPATELAKAEEEVALAQVNLVQARREAGKGASDRTQKLNAELAQIAVSRAEAQAKSEFVERHLEKAQEDLQKELNSAQPLREQISIEAAAAHELAVEVRKQETEFRRRSSYQPARVEVFDLKQDDDPNPRPAKAENDPKPKP